MAAAKHLPIWRDAHRLVSELHRNTRKAPRDLRYTLIQRLLDQTVELCVDIADANRATGQQRAAHLATLQQRIVRVEVLLQIALDQKCISLGAGANAMESIDSVARQAYGWARSNRSGHPDGRTRSDNQLLPRHRTSRRHLAAPRSLVPVRRTRRTDPRTRPNEGHHPEGTSMISGTLTLKPRPLPNVCDAVYLLDDADLDPLVTVTYEASLDGGTTWEEVTPGELTALAHDGDTLQVRVTMEVPDESDEEGRVFWFVAYATQEETA